MEPAAFLTRARLWRRVSGGGPVPARRVSDPPPGSPAPQSERLLQCVWYDPALRPQNLRTADGERVRVIAPGRWNTGPGPDFLRACLELGPGRRRIEGDVEVHMRPGDWDAHGHAADPRYRSVRAHVTYRPGRAPSGLPTGSVRIALSDALSATPGFSFDRIDPAAYPYAARTAPCPCAAVLAAWPPGRIAELLEAAGEERIRRKAVRLRAPLAERGAEQVLYEETMTALGFRDNKAPFRRLAEILPWDRLRETSGGDPDAAYAVLAGVSGLLPAAPRPDWDAETRRWLRGLWDVWWKRAESANRLSRPDWALSGFRPAYHPLRRLAAAAWLFGGPRSLLDDLRRALPGPAAGVPRRLLDRLCAPPGGYWRRRLRVGGRLQESPVALLGRARAAAVLHHAVLPFFAATGERAAFRGGWARSLPPEGDSGILRMTAAALLGPDAPPSWTRPALRRQGLLQIFQDFCLNDRNGCRDCGLPERLAAAGSDPAPGSAPDAGAGMGAARRAGTRQDRGRP